MIVAGLQSEELYSISCRNGREWGDLSSSGPDLVDHYAEHEYEINPERPEQNHFGAGQLATRDTGVCLWRK